ncbi:MAG: HAD-IIA family hydrolase [Candidatus Methanofastidiosa archaeon]|nr:HAD-IIA family hydrolase [Candidatus Methanofastidiosa archaeon]
MAIGYLIDIDGVIRVGDRPIPSAIAFVDSLLSRKIPFLLVTNNSTRTQLENARMLGALGLSMPPEMIVTSAMVTGRYISSRMRGARAYVIGEPGLRETLRSYGVVMARSSPDFVVVGLDWHFTYYKMKTATLALRRGAELIATNTDVSFPLPEGLVPGAGALVASISAATGMEPIVMGKPNPPMFELSLSMIGMERGEVVVIGDRMDTDIAGAKRAGMRSILVTTGVSKVPELPADASMPERVVASLSEIDPEEPL